MCIGFFSTGLGLTLALVEPVQSRTSFVIELSPSRGRSCPTKRSGGSYLRGAAFNIAVLPVAQGYYNPGLVPAFLVLLGRRTTSVS